MGSYGKILKKRSNNIFKTELLLLDSLGKSGAYYELMKEKYDQGYTQVIINSYLMLKIAESMLKDGWIILEIEIDDPVIDLETKSQIKRLVESIKVNILNFNKLTSYLEWVLDEGSILIDRITLAKKDQVHIFRSEINSKGIIVGDIKKEIHQLYIKNVVEEFLNG